MLSIFAIANEIRAPFIESYACTSSTSIMLMCVKCDISILSHRIESGIPLTALGVKSESTNLCACSPQVCLDQLIFSEDATT